MTDFKVGEVTHYYDKINIAILKLTGNLSLGDKVRIVSKDGEFTQSITLMLHEHQQIKTAEKEQTIGLKVNQPVNVNSLVYKTI